MPNASERPRHSGKRTLSMDCKVGAGVSDLARARRRNASVRRYPPPGLWRGVESMKAGNAEPNLIAVVSMLLVCADGKEEEKGGMGEGHVHTDALYFGQLDHTRRYTSSAYQVFMYLSMFTFPKGKRTGEHHASGGREGS